MKNIIIVLQLALTHAVLASGDPEGDLKAVAIGYNERVYTNLKHSDLWTLRVSKFNENRAYRMTDDFVLAEDYLIRYLEAAYKKESVTVEYADMAFDDDRDLVRIELKIGLKDQVLNPVACYIQGYKKPSRLSSIWHSNYVFRESFIRKLQTCLDRFEQHILKQKPKAEVSAVVIALTAEQRDILEIAFDRQWPALLDEDSYNFLDEFSVEFGSIGEVVTLEFHIVVKDRKDKVVLSIHGKEIGFNGFEDLVESNPMNPKQIQLSQKFTEVLSRSMGSPAK